MNPKYSFIVPFFNHWDLTHARLGEFRKFLPDDCEIILIDDASTDEDVRKGISFWQKSGIARHNIRYKRNEVNSGFIKSMNLGASIARGEFLVLYSNDVVMFRDVTKDLEAGFDQWKGEILIGNRIIDWKAGWNEVKYRGGISIVPYLEGWFLSCRKPVWDRLGGFDERYGISDFEDVDLSTTAQYLHIPIFALNSTAIKHLGAQSFRYSPERENRTKANKQIWEEKWQDKWDEFFR